MYLPVHGWFGHHHLAVFDQPFAALQVITQETAPLSGFRVWVGLVGLFALVS